MLEKEKQSYYNLIMPRMNNETIKQFSELKTFIDNTLNSAMSKDFETQEERSNFLVKSLQQLSDFLFTQVIDNNLRLQLTQSFKKVEEDLINQEALMGNEKLESEKFENQGGK
jgi:hypothetical protein